MILTLTLSLALVNVVQGAEQLAAVVSTQTDHAAGKASESQPSSATQSPAAKTNPSKQSSKTSQRLVRIFVAPIEATWDGLSHPVEWLKFTQRLLRLKSTTDMDDAFTARDQRIALDVNTIRIPEYNLASVLRPGTVKSNGMSLSRYVEVQKPNEAFESAITQQSTTQLQIRMQRNWMMLYEVTHTTSAIERDDIGFGLGLRYAF